MAFHIYLWTGLRGVIVGIIGLNVLYLGLLFFYPVPECGPTSLAESCNFPDYLDEIVIDGFRWNSTAFDPDGVGAILPPSPRSCSASSRESCCGASSDRGSGSCCFWAGELS